MSQALSPRSPARISLDHVVETPENVVLTYQLAGPVVRLAAYMIDLILRIALFVAFAFISSIAFARYVPGLTLAALLVLFFVLDWLYFAICEGCFRGKTPGKHMYGLRVIHAGGYPISFWEAMVRNLVRAMDSVSFYGVGWLTMLASGGFRRLGDLVGQTVVVEEKRVTVPREPIILEKIQPLARGELGGWIPPAKTMALIEEFLGRRGVLTHVRGHSMAVGLARTLAGRLNYQGALRQVEEYPMAFLARVYATFYRADDDGTPAEILDLPKGRQAGAVAAEEVFT
ncbi:MAG: RDD family protein [Planctomycetaceae bacterium]|nr:MAG: RDD family protein [Planctomycetaceae bacterium]